MIIRFDKYNENKEEYPFVEYVDIMNIGYKFFDEYDYMDCLGFENRLKKLLLNNLVEFKESTEDDEIQDGRMMGGKIIKGIITDINISSFFEYEIIIKFTIENVGEFEVFPEQKVKVFLKEERIKKEINRDIDPYGEEDWDD